MSECKRVRDLLALRPTDWSDSEGRQVEVHLRSCVECRAVAQAYAEQDQRIQAAPRVGLTLAQREQLFSRIRRAEKWRARRTRAAAALGTVAAIVALVALLWGLGLLFHHVDQPTVSLPGPGVADLLRQPRAQGEAIEVDAYFSGAQPVAMFGFPRPPDDDQVYCPTFFAWQVVLTDQPFSPAVYLLSSTWGNVLPDDAPWLAATTPEAMQPGQIVLPQLPYHARFRGHLGDPALAHCPNADRIFVVEEVVAVYAEQPPATAGGALQVPKDYANWPRYHDTALGYSLPYPPDWTVELPGPDLVVAVDLRAPQWPDYPVMVRVHAGEMLYDQYDPASIPPLLQGQAFGVFEQGWAFDGRIEGQHLAGFQVDRPATAGEGEGSVSVLFSANGYTYELALRFAMGFDAPQQLLAIYSAMVEGFRLDRIPGPTPTPPVKQTLGPGPFLSQDEALARLRESQSQDLDLLDAELLSELGARRLADACGTFESHPDGVWVLLVRGSFEGMRRDVRFFVEASSGEVLCGEELMPAPGPTAATPDASGSATASASTLDALISHLAVELEQNEGNTFAGLWIQQEPAYRIVVAFTRDGEETIRPYVAGTPLDGLIEVRTATATLAELEAAQQEVHRLLDGLGLSVASGINVQENRVELYVTDRPLFEATLQEAHVVLPEQVVVVTVYEPLGENPPFALTPEPTLHFPRLRMRSATFMEALLEGTLVLRDGCLRIRDGDGDDGYLIIWQVDYYVNNSAGTIEILDKSGQVVARVGEVIRMGGGEVPMTDGLQQQLREPLPGECQGPYWLMGELVTGE
jgi:hypothetical protein